jgi:hypothetical protein
MQISHKLTRLTGVFLGLFLVSGTLFSQEIQVNLQDPGKIDPPQKMATSELPFTPAKSDRTLRFIEEIPASATAGDIKTLAVIDRIIQVDTGELPAVIWSDLNVTQSYFLQEALRTSVSDSVEWKRLKYYGWSLLNPDDDYLSSYGEFYMGFFDSIQNWLTQKSDAQRNRLKQITLLSERNYTPSYISDWGKPDLQTSQMMGMWLHYLEKNKLHTAETSLNPAIVSDIQIHYESLRAFWKSQLWTDSVNYYKELKGESDDEFATINMVNEETSFDAISAYYKFVLLNPLKMNLKWRSSGIPNWTEYRLIQMWEASCKMAANSSKFTEIADKLNSDFYLQKEFKNLVNQTENAITISNLSLSKEWSTVKNDPSKMATVYVMLRYLDYDKSDIPAHLPYGYLVSQYFSELPFSVFYVVKDSIRESSNLKLRWQDFDVFDASKNVKAVAEYNKNGYRFSRGWEAKDPSEMALVDSIDLADSAIVDTAMNDTAMNIDDFDRGDNAYNNYDENIASTRYRRQTQFGVGASYLQLFKSQSALNSTINKTFNSYGIASLSQLSAVGFEAWLTPDNTMTGFSYHVNNGLVSGLSDELKSPAQYTSRYVGFSSGGIFKRRYYEIGSGGTYGHFVQRIVMPQSATGTAIYNAKRTEVIENKSFVYGLFVESKLKLKYLYVKIHGGYQWDFSDRRWQYRDQFINSSDRFSLSSFYASVSAGILLNQN